MVLTVEIRSGGFSGRYLGDEARCAMLPCVFDVGCPLTSTPDPRGTDALGQRGVVGRPRAFAPLCVPGPRL